MKIKTGDIIVTEYSPAAQEDIELKAVIHLALSKDVLLATSRIKLDDSLVDYESNFAYEAVSVIRHSYKTYQGDSKLLTAPKKLDAIRYIFTRRRK